jgi:hypothetical protein
MNQKPKNRGGSKIQRKKKQRENESKKTIDRGRPKRRKKEK